MAYIHANDEEKAKEGFDKLNNQLNEDMYKANKYANILMPIANNLGNLQYVLIAIIGTVLALNGTMTLTIGTIVSFLQLTRNFTQPINQVMNQLNPIIMALAGAGRIFEMMDEEPEQDNGYVTLVNVKNENGTNSWKNGTPTAIKYPTFQPVTYSMNYLRHEDAFNLARAMTEEGNIYGFRSANTDTHLMKDSEWGMVAYLSQSQYGLNGTNICINNVSLNSGGSSTTKEEGNAYASVYAITGCTTAEPKAGEKIVTDFNTIKNLTGNNPSTDGVYVWND